MLFGDLGGLIGKTSSPGEALKVSLSQTALVADSWARQPSPAQVTRHLEHPAEAEPSGDSATDPCASPRIMSQRGPWCKGSVLPGASPKTELPGFPPAGLSLSRGGRDSLATEPTRLSRFNSSSAPCLHGQSGMKSWNSRSPRAASQNTLSQDNRDSSSCTTMCSAWLLLPRSVWKVLCQPGLWSV